MPEISVVIPTFNSRDALALTLESVTHQTMESRAFEVVVLDDGSTDGTRDVVKKISDSFPVRYAWQANTGRAAARNAGARLARSPVILFLDADIIVERDLLERHRSYYRAHPGPIGVQGRTLIHPDVRTNVFMRTKGLVPDLTWRRRTDLSPYHVITRNLSLRAEDLWRVGGFDESFPGYGWEDIELGLRLRAGGVRFFYAPEALGYHYDVETLARTREKLRQAGEGAVYFWRKHRRSHGLGLFLEIHPVLLPLKWLVYRTRALGALARRILPWAERGERLWICSECYNHLLWEAYYDGVFRALSRQQPPPS